MPMKLEAQNPREYLYQDAVIDHNHPAVAALAKQLSLNSNDEVETARRIFLYVRDEISHSGDIGALTVTCRASEVLAERHGNCCGKSHLMAALMRYLGIPTGFCYQWLSGDNRPGYLVIHGLNGVYLQSLQRWIRLDARGNKPGVRAEFSTTEEILAWPVRPEMGEMDDPVIYRSPKKEVIEALTTQTIGTQREIHWVSQKKTSCQFGLA